MQTLKGNDFFILKQNVMSKEIEIWKPMGVVKGIDFAGRYEISSLCQVKSLFDPHGKERELILCPILTYWGYFTVNLYKDKKVKVCRLHRIFANAFIPNPHNKPMINHINGIKTDNRIENLEWVTAKENINHAHRTGLAIVRKGEESRNNKLKNKDVNKIRMMYKKGVRVMELSEIFSVHHQNIYKILRRETWNHV